MAGEGLKVGFIDKWLVTSDKRELGHRVISEKSYRGGVSYPLAEWLVTGDELRMVKQS